MPTANVYPLPTNMPSTFPLNSPSLELCLHHGRHFRIAVPQIRLLFPQVCARLNMSLANVRHSTDRASQRRAMTDERGPFGKNTSRRGTSRSKGTPGGKKGEDK